MTSYVTIYTISSMSQITTPDKISTRGKDIEEYLSSRYLEPWSSKTRKLEKDEVSEMNICPYCNQQLERSYWEPRYRGIKAKCRDCDVVWNLS